jgi:hypothetical protein
VRCSRRERRERHAREHPIGVSLHQQAIYERARISLVAVADQVPGAVGGCFGGRAPLDRGRKTRSAAAPQPRLLDLAADALAVARPGHLLPDAPGIRSGSGDAGEHDRFVDLGARRDLGIARFGPARELLDEVRPRAGVLAVERRRAAVAVAEAVDGL